MAVRCFDFVVNGLSAIVNSPTHTAKHAPTLLNDAKPVISIRPDQYVRLLRHVYPVGFERLVVGP